MDPSVLIPPHMRGQVALVTGAGRRLGRAIAVGLAGEGIQIVVHCHTSVSQAASLVAELQAGGVGAWLVRADLSDSAQAAELVTQAQRACGQGIDILINSASIFDPSRLLEFSADELDANVRINALAPLLLSRGMAAQDKPGQVINLLDARVAEYDRQHAAYHLSKRMLLALTRLLALELAPQIRVNAVAPGLILPPPGKDAAYLQGLAAGIPLQRHGDAADVVRAVMFLLASDFMTGQVLFVDGGASLQGSTYGT